MQESRRQQYLQAMGIQLWEMRYSPESNRLEPVVETEDRVQLESLVTEREIPAATADNLADLDWPALKSRVESCQACQLHESRIYPVFGAGDQNAKVMFIGEAPGADEDRQAAPFVGTAGKLLMEMLLAAGLTREQVYLTNTIKCRPPANRKPESSEIDCCASFLQRQIALVQPALLVALGRVAAQNLLKNDHKLADMRGRLHTGHGDLPPVLVTYHPAHLLRRPLHKREAWDDLRFVLAAIQQGEQT